MWQLLFLVSLSSAMHVVYEHNNSTLLRDIPLLLAHDAGTSYLADDARFVKEEVIRWTKTQQDGGFAKLLSCGARGLDIRPKMSETGDVIMHHGVVSLPKTLTQGVADIVEWSRMNSDQVILLYLSHFAKPVAETKEKTRSILAKARIPVLSNCEEINTITWGELIQIGPIVSIIDCVTENFDPGVVCETFDFSCVSPGRDQGAFNRLDKYMQIATSQESNKTGLRMAQAHWQINPLDIVMETFRSGSTLSENHNSNLNHWIAEKFKRRHWKLPNLLELDNICEGGLEILKALQMYKRRGIEQVKE